MPLKRKRWNRYHNTLAGFVQALQESRIVVEMRADTIIRGKLESSDEYLNLSLTDVTVQDHLGNKQQYEYLFLRGKNIRYIHLPQALDPAMVLQEHRRKMTEARRSNAVEMLNRHVATAKGVDALQQPEGEWGAMEQQEGGQEEQAAQAMQE